MERGHHPNAGAAFTITSSMVAESKRALITRVSPGHLEALKQAFGQDKLEWNSRARTVVIHGNSRSSQAVHSLFEFQKAFL